MLPEIYGLVVGAAGWVIAGLLGINLFFVRDFMRRIEHAISHLADTIASHAEKLTKIDKSFTERIARMDAQLDELRARKLDLGKGKRFEN